MKNRAVQLIFILLLQLLLAPSFSSSNALSEAPSPQWSKLYTRMLNYSVDGFAVSAEDEGRRIIASNNGGYVIYAALDDHHYAPHTGGVDNRTGMLIKTDSSGEVQWERGNSLVSAPNSIFQTHDLGFILSGNSQLLKLDAEGNVQWNRTFKGSLDIWGYQTYYSINSVIQTPDRSYVSAGYLPDYNGAALLFKTDENGNLLWNKMFNASFGGSSASDVVEDGDGGYVIVGQRDGAWFAKTDSSGNLKLNRNFSELKGYFNSAVRTKDGAFVLVGGTYQGGVDNQGQGLIAKVNSLGNIQWSHTFNNPPYQGFTFYSVAQIGDGGLVAVGRTATFKIDDSGNLLWYLTSANDVADVLGSMNSVTATDDGGFAVVGGTGNSVWVAKFASESINSPIELSFLLPLIVAVVVIVAVVAVAALVYWRKRKRQTQ